MAGVDYCTVLPSWEFDKDPACVVSYMFDSIDGLSEDTATDYIPPNNFMNSCLTLECSSNDQLTGDSREPCTLSITSKPHYRVSVLGVDIISQSRSLEVYDTCEGYMMTSRGKRIPCLDAEGGENQSDMFSCRVRLKETLFGFTVKFPSTSNMKKFNIYNIVLVLNPEPEDGGNKEVPSSFNMDKVRSFVDTESMSPGAQQLMRTVEQYQQNKMSTASGLQGMFGQSSSRSAGSGGGPGMMGLMGLMSMFSNMSSPSQSGSQNTPTGSNNTLPGQTDSRGIPQVNNSLTPSQSNTRNISPAMNRTAPTRLDPRGSDQVLNNPVANQQPGKSTATSQTRESHQQTDTAPNRQTSPNVALPSSLNLSELQNALVGASNLRSGVSSEFEGSAMYQTLKNICGQVSEMRVVDPKESKSATDTGTEQLDSNNPQRLEENIRETGQRSEDETAGEQKLSQDTIRTVVKSCMEEFEVRLQNRIDDRLSQIEQKLEAKLDSILGVLHTLKGDNSSMPKQIPIHHPPDIPLSTEDPTHLSTEGPTHLSTEGATPLSTEGPTHLSTEGATHLSTEGPTHLPTEGATHLSTEGATHLPTEDTTHILTEGATHIPTEGATHIPTEGATHMPTGGTTHLSTESPTHLPTEDTTHLPTEDTTHILTEGATHIPTEGATHIPTEGPTHLPTGGTTQNHIKDITFFTSESTTYVHKVRTTCTHTSTDVGNESSTDLQNKRSTEEIRTQPAEKTTNSKVMDDESGENS